MKGKVLGFDAASGTGAITGDDGNRYNFTAADNKSPAPLKQNDTVDFEIEGNAAKNIYAVKTGFSIPNVGAGGASAAGGAAPAGGDVVQMLLAKPYVLWAAVIILGSLIAGYFSSLSLLEAMNGPFGTGLGISALLGALMIGIPIVAGVLIFFEFTNSALTPLFRLVTATAAIGGPIIIPFLAGLLAPEMYKQAMGMAAAFGAGGRVMGGGFIGFSITPGMLITVAGGVLIVLTHLGILKLPTKP